MTIELPLTREFQVTVITRVSAMAIEPFSLIVHLYDLISEIGARVVVR